MYVNQRVRKPFYDDNLDRRFRNKDGRVSSVDFCTPKNVFRSRLIEYDSDSDGEDM